MARLTRAQSQARTRDQLVATARELFLRDGYAVTSLDRVADEAGYSKGAVYSNFRGKTDLCLAVLDQIHTEQIALVVEAVRGTRTITDRLAAFQDWAEANIGNQAWTALEVEFAVAGRHDPAVLDQIARRDRAMREAIAALITAQADELGVALPLPAQTIATALLSLGIGIGVRRAVDPSTPVSTLTEAIRVLAGLPAGNQPENRTAVT